MGFTDIARGFPFTTKGEGNDLVSLSLFHYAERPPRPLSRHASAFLRSGVAVNPALAKEHTAAARAPVPAGGLLLAQVIKAVLHLGFIHIRSEHQAAIAKGAGFIKKFLKHGNTS